MAMQALAHVAAHIFVPIAWLEAGVLRDRPQKWDRFAVRTFRLTMHVSQIHIPVEGFANTFKKTLGPVFFYFIFS